MKATATAPANIAFIKYWGKADEKTRLPLNASFSMNLSGAYTTTTVEFSGQHLEDSVSAIDEDFSMKEIKRITQHLDLIREKANVTTKAKVVTKNTFPKGTGAAASASGFAALTVAACNALGLSLTEKEMTILARLGSGSACRSIPDGFVLWEKGSDSDSSYAYSLYPESYWDLRDLLVIVDTSMKKISTSEGMEKIKTSSFWKTRIAGIPDKIKRIQTYFEKKDFTALGALIEEDCVNMHAVAMTQNPSVLYWNSQTLAMMHAVYSWRQSGLKVFFTIDAGPNVHLICEGKDEQKVLEEVKKTSGIKQIISNKPAKGTRLIKDHLF